MPLQLNAPGSSTIFQALETPGGGRKIKKIFQFRKGSSKKCPPSGRANLVSRVHPCRTGESLAHGHRNLENRHLVTINIFRNSEKNKKIFIFVKINKKNFFSLSAFGGFPGVLRSSPWAAKPCPEGAAPPPGIGRHSPSPGEPFPSLGSPFRHA